MREKFCGTRHTLAASLFEQLNIYIVWTILLKLKACVIEACATFGGKEFILTKTIHV